MPDAPGANGHKCTAPPCPCNCGRNIRARTCYVTYKCREDACEEANRRYARRNAKMHTMGKPSPFVDAAPLRARLAEFSAEGVGYKQVAKVAGVAKSSLSQVSKGTMTRVRLETADKVLALPIDPTRQAADRALIDARPTWNRLHALMATGWTAAALSARLGFAANTVQMGEDLVTAANARKVLALFNELRDTPGPTPLNGRRGGNRAHIRDGDWPHPLDLDVRGFVMPSPDDVDDERDIDQVAIDRRYEGHWTVKLNAEEKAEAVRQGLARGLTRTEMARSLGYSGQTINAIVDSLDTAAA